MMMEGEPRADVATDDASRCRHTMRLRESFLGFASPETVCVECGESFDADEEQELRHRYQAAQRETTRVTARQSYLVG